MKFCLTLLVVFNFALSVGLNAQETDTAGTLIFEDKFDRDESSPDLEEVGNGWTTNSRTRAKSEKQVDLLDGAIQIAQAAVADHSVLVQHDLGIKDGRVKLRFQLNPQGVLVLNFADMNEKSVHSGHLFQVAVRLSGVELTDLKTGRMNEEIRARQLSNAATKDDAELLKKKTSRFKLELPTDQWHDVEATIAGDVLSVKIDGKAIGSLQSLGIAQPNKQKLRLLVIHSAVVDDVSIWKN